MNWFVGHVTLTFMINLENKIYSRTVNVTFGYVTSVSLLSIAGKLNWCVGHGQTCACYLKNVMVHNYKLPNLKWNSLPLQIPFAEK